MTRETLFGLHMRHAQERHLRMHEGSPKREDYDSEDVWTIDSKLYARWREDYEKGRPKASSRC